jgi:pimeloyl-ACP methyl ester carboxylesterase
MPIAHLSTVDLYYELHGDPEAPPLVLLHGATETFRTGWRQQIEPFSRHYRLIGVDLRGHGRSNNPANRLDLRQMADDIHELLGSLGYASAHVCGHSGGASTALFLAVRHPDCLRSLILVSNNFERDRARASMDFWNPERIRQEQPRWWQELQHLHPEAERLLRWWAEEDVQRPDFRPEELQHIQTPTLLLNGDRDEIIPLDQTLKLYHILPNAQLGIVPGARHHLPLRRPEVFNVLVLTFLEKQEAKHNEGIRRKKHGEHVLVGTVSHAYPEPS